MAHWEKPLCCSVHGLHGCQATRGPEFKSGPSGLSVHTGQLVHFRVMSQAGTESSLICDHWLVLGLETLSYKSLLEPLIKDSILLHALVSH